MTDLLAEYRTRIPPNLKTHLPETGHRMKLDDFVKTLKEVVLEHGLPSDGCRRGDFFRDKTQRDELRFIEAAAKYTLMQLNLADDPTMGNVTFARREVLRLHEALTHDYAHILLPSGYNEWKGLELDRQDHEKLKKMREVFDTKHTHADKALDHFAAVIDEEIGQLLARQGIDLPEKLPLSAALSKEPAPLEWHL